MVLCTCFLPIGPGSQADSAAALQVQHIRALSACTRFHLRPCTLKRVNLHSTRGASLHECCTPSVTAGQFDEVWQQTEPQIHVLHHHVYAAHLPLSSHGQNSHRPSKYCCM